MTCSDKTGELKWHTDQDINLHLKEEKKEKLTIGQGLNLIGLDKSQAGCKDY